MIKFELRADYKDDYLRCFNDLMFNLFTYYDSIFH